MRNLLQYPITDKEVIQFLKDAVTIEGILTDATQDCGNIDPMCAKVALAVVEAAATIVQNDIGSDAAFLLNKAFRSQDIPIKETA